MKADENTDNQPLPGTVFNPRQVRLLKIAVIVMGVMLVGGFLVVLFALVYQASHVGTTGAPRAVSGSPMQFDVPLPQGATVSQMALDGNRLALHVTAGKAREIVVIDLRSGQVVSRVRLTPK